MPDRPVNITTDDVDAILHADVPALLNELHKFSLHLMLSHQDLDQLSAGTEQTENHDDD